MENIYPVWRYHQEKMPEGIIVRSADQDKALGEGWVDTPAKFVPKQPEGESPVAEPSLEPTKRKRGPKVKEEASA